MPEYARRVEQIVSRHMAPAVLSAKLATFARKTLAEAVSSGRASPIHRTYVDGVEGAREETVRPDGAILYRFAVLPQATAFVLSYLAERAPRGSGRLSNSFVLFVRQRGSYGNLIRAGSFDPQRMDAAADQVTIANVQPYSRKADVQKVGKRILLFSRRAGMYDDAVAAVRRRFPGVTAEREYRVVLPRPYMLRRGKNAGRPVETPGVVLGLKR